MTNDAQTIRQAVTLQVPGDKLLLVGDLTWPHPTPPRLELAGHDLGRFSLIPNVEGPILERGATHRLRPHVVGGIWNSPSVCELLGATNTKVACVANNHLADYRDRERPTAEALSDHGIHAAGYGTTREEAARPVLVTTEDGRRILLFFFAEDRIGSRPANRHQPGVNIFRPELAARQIREERSRAKPDLTVAVVHWGYELQSLPSPEQRILARRMIESGADIMVGHHAHVCQGFETHEDGTVYYSLGNFLMWEGNYDSLTVRYPAAVRTSAALLLDAHGPRVVKLAADVEEGIVRVVQGPLPPHESFLTELSPFSDHSTQSYEALYRSSVTVSWWYPLWTGRESLLARQGKRLWLATVQNVRLALIRLRRRLHGSPPTSPSDPSHSSGGGHD